ncbi:hypothetical protein WBG78_12785 [Chryseolinea sp. T2]|uniref:hypothetical protein n=1 Tax=Chryseolinea sp. T2 TaxID=3129255 RepID=UPI0030787E3A
MHEWIVLFNVNQNISSWTIDAPLEKSRVYIIYDESGRVPFELADSKRAIILHAYLKEYSDVLKSLSIAHFPLCCNSSVPELPYIPIQSRKINVFYSGNLHAGRTKLFQALTGWHALPLSVLSRVHRFFRLKFDSKFKNSYIRFSGGFGQGLNNIEYAKALSESKIILSPPGISNDECFRHYEGLRAGCIVIAERLPPKPFLENSPIITVTDWTKGFDEIARLLSDENALAHRSQLSRDWHLNNFSVTGVSNYIQRTLSDFSSTNPLQ